MTNTFCFGHPATSLAVGVTCFARNQDSSIVLFYTLMLSAVKLAQYLHAEVKFASARFGIVRNSYAQGGPVFAILGYKAWYERGQGSPVLASLGLRNGLVFANLK